jgi:murein DD-endopeptidase MepM/ murein hydrolase activator NlpD
MNVQRTTLRVVLVMLVLLGWDLMEAVINVAGANTDLQVENTTLQARVTELEGWVRAQRYVGGAAIGNYLFPIHPDDYIMPTSPFGERENPFTGEEENHIGVDLFGVWKARIVSVADGVVIEHWVPPNGDPRWKGHKVYGGMLRIKHDDGTIALYGHLSETYVHEGERVKAGQVIARQGETGQATGPHLHFELEVGGKIVNPLKWVVQNPEDPIPGQEQSVVDGS